MKHTQSHSEGSGTSHYLSSDGYERSGGGGGGGGEEEAPSACSLHPHPAVAVVVVGVDSKDSRPHYLRGGGDGGDGGGGSGVVVVGGGERWWGADGKRRAWNNGRTMSTRMLSEGEGFARSCSSSVVDCYSRVHDRCMKVSVGWAG